MSIDRTAIISDTARFHAIDRVVIGPHARIDDGVVITGNVEIGAYVHIGAYCVLTGKHGIRIGDYSAISPFTAIFSASDDYSGGSMCGPCIPDEFKPGLQIGRVTVGRNVIIGAHSTLLPAITIGNGAAIGAHSMVKRDCLPNWIYAGTPAKAVRERKSDIWKLTEKFIEEITTCA